MINYLITKTHCIANNAKCHTNAICRAIVNRDLPDAAAEIRAIQDEAKMRGEEVPELIHRSYIETTEDPHLPVAILMREPIDRFISAASMNDAHELEDIFEDLKNGGEWTEDHVMLRQSDYVRPGAKIFRFPEDTRAFCQEVGFKLPLATVNKNKGKKIVLTDEQLAIVKEYYAEDIKLFSSLPVA